MTIERNVSLADYSTMALGGEAQYKADITSRDDLIEAISFASANRLKILMVGGGSNIVWRDEGFKGLLLVNKIRGFEVEREDETGADILVGAGEDWDLVVDRSVSLGLSGIECLSLVPGTAGATPVQNVGAYGQEIAETLVSLEAYDTKSKSFMTMLNRDCDFSYRNSCFKSRPGRYFILSIRLHLKKDILKPPLYKVLEDYLKDKGLSDTSPKVIRDAVVDIRRRKLPDPKVVKNCGSFFKNPIITKDEFDKLAKDFKDVSHWEMKSGHEKISAAWLIDQAGFKDYTDPASGMATWKGQPLILVNEHASSTGDLLRFKEKITIAVKNKFGIELTQEPELLP
ncbi:MAG TPA: UDP-N-acetylmuramate dehydrogenase [Candidatus Saccharimonadales bacterium]|jgi:UDP-N-acetylmuramate dehydrogenase